jgi:xylonate dehydratase
LELDHVIDSGDEGIFEVRTRAPGPEGSLPITPEMLLQLPSGTLFGMTQSAGMGWAPEALLGKQVLILSTHGGVRAPDGTPIALGYHTGHWEVGLLVAEAARQLKSLGAIPFAGACTDPCDGRSQGTSGMFDSLPYRNDAAVVFRRLIRSLPTRSGVIGVATCDKGLPAMMMALAGMHDLPTALVPGGVTLMPEHGEDAGKVQTIGARFAHHKISLQEAALAGCRACASAGGGCQFLGTAATSQVVAEALGLTVVHAALAPSGEPVWLDMARRTARAMLRMEGRKLRTRDILTDQAIENAMVLHAAFGGSTNLLLHIPAIAFSAGLRRPTVADWERVNRSIPRIVDVLPNGPQSHSTVQVFLAGGVPEVMLHLRRAGVLNAKALTVSGETLDHMLDWWEQSERRQKFRARLTELDGVNPDDVILSPDSARSRGLTSTVCFPSGNLAPEGCVVKSTSIDPSVVDENEVYRLCGPARTFVTEHDAIAGIKDGTVREGDIMVLMCRGPMGTGMEEIYQITSALKHLPFGKYVAVITDARFSGVSTGACLGHVSPEALAGGPVGKVRDGDVIEIVIDRMKLEGKVNLVGEGDERFDAAEGARRLAARPKRDDLAPDPELPTDTRLWAALQHVSGGIWGGSVYDAEAIIARLALD